VTTLSEGVSSADVARATERAAADVMTLSEEVAGAEMARSTARAATDVTKLSESAPTGRARRRELPPT
jgi:hypothetical protein